MASLSDSRLPLLGVSRESLGLRFAEWGLSPVHLARLWNYLYWEGLTSLEDMVELPVRVRGRLLENFSLIPPTVAAEAHSSDGFTRKFLLQLEDARRVETVLMRFTGRVTACISSQVGCAMGCTFCATGQMGFLRNLRADEIIAQAMHIQRLLRVGVPKSEVASARLRNVVLMGMGEPLHNYDEVMAAIDILRDQSGIALASSRVTLSTVGVVPGIRRLTREARQLHLAVSLHGATQEERARLVPVAKKWPLDELMDACREYTQVLDRRIFFEWTLIEGQNDGPEDARAVGRLVSTMPAQVNLIPLNPTPGFAGSPAQNEAAKRFQHILREEFSVPSTVRQRRGIDIAAGCGQLASRVDGAGA